MRKVFRLRRAFSTSGKVDFPLFPRRSHVREQEQLNLNTRKRLVSHLVRQVFAKTALLDNIYIDEEVVEVSRQTSQPFKAKKARSERERKPFLVLTCYVPVRKANRFDCCLSLTQFIHLASGFSSSLSTSSEAIARETHLEKQLC
jgi:hypothetical protein